MATLLNTKDLVATYKKEMVLSLGALSKVHAMSSDLSNTIFRDTAYEKPTQKLFYQLSYYLVNIFDTSAARNLCWPLYDTAAERAFRSDLSKLLSDYSSKGLLSPVMPSYLVNPGCFKVTLLLFEMSQLALKKTINTVLVNEYQKKQFNDVTNVYQSGYNDSLMQNVEKTSVRLLTKISNHMYRTKKFEEIASKMRKRITEMELQLSLLKPQDYINELVDGFVNTHDLDETTRMEIVNMKNVNKSSKFFESWHSDVDKRLSEIENKWDEKMNPFIKLASDAQTATEMLITRQTGQADKSMYMLEFNPKTDQISMEGLLCEVNTEQKYILKNIIRNDQLNFPNLIRGFLVAISYVQLNTDVDNEIYRFNECLDCGRRRLSEMVSTMQMVLERVKKSEAKLKPRQQVYNPSSSLKDLIDIPPLPDLSDLKMSNLPYHNRFDAFTPLNTIKYQFNLQRKSKSMFTKPQARHFPIAATYQKPQDDFLKSVVSYRDSSHNYLSTTQYSTQNLNASIISQTNSKCNETIAESSQSSRFTKQQLMRLLSTKKSSSSKKAKVNFERPSNPAIKKGGMFNKTSYTTSTDSSSLYRSYSSPNLSENSEKRPRIGKKLSKLTENCPLLEVSGISALGKDTSYGTPEGVCHLGNSCKLFDVTSLPSISMSPVEQITEENYIKNNTPLHSFADMPLNKLNNIIKDNENSNAEIPQNSTPTNNPQLIPKTKSLEKIINRFKKVRASIMPSTENVDDFKTIAEEGNYMVNIDTGTANKVLLPDLISPGHNVVSKQTESCLETNKVVTRIPRESLGTVFGVDHTFLDQFDLSD